jgi:hypothetical protein
VKEGSVRRGRGEIMVARPLPEQAIRGTSRAEGGGSCKIPNQQIIEDNLYRKRA